MTLLRVDDLEVSHGPLQALWGVSLSISAGEKVGLLGANGAGKSTTLGAIVGHYPAQAGRIAFDGRDETRSDVNSRLSRGMALVPEGRRPRWLVCLSGGKDSYTLLSVLLDLQWQGALPVDLLACNLDQGQPGFDKEILPTYFAKIGVS